jgi:ribosomal protein L11 methyltransferase
MAELTRITFTLTPDKDTPDMLTALLSLHCPHGWEERSLPTGELCCVVHSGHPGFNAELIGAVRAVLPEIDVRSEIIQEENWAEAWKEFFTPVQGGEHFLVLAPWMEEERARTKRIPIIIEPKTAFGTGHHETTALCLEALSRLFSQQRILSATRFLDLGTGSGILGIAAARLGLRGEGLDIDVVAVDNALENRVINDLEPESFRVERGGVEQARGPFGLIMANILAAPLREMAPQIVALLDTKGVVVLSGILDIQADALEDVYTRLGLKRLERFSRGEGVCLVFA